MQDLNVIRKFIENTEQEFSEFSEHAQQGFDYYDNKGKIKQTGAAAIDEVNTFLKAKGSNPLHTADNRISLNRHSIAVDQKSGYLFSIPPKFDLPADDKDSGDKELLKSVNDIIGTQWAKVVKQLGIDASNTARAWLAYWITDDGKFDYWYINPLTMRPVYDRSSVKKKLQYLIRIYAYLDALGNPVTRYEFWDEKEVAYLIKPAVTAENGNPQIDFELIPNGNYNILKNTYGRIPFIEFRNKAALLPDLPMYKDIIDAMDKVMSGFINDIDDLQEIIWVIQNYEGETSKIDYDKDGNEIEKTIDLLQKLKTEKWVSVGEKGNLTPVTGEVPHEARMKALEALDKEFWIAAKAVNPNPPTAGNQSGVYIDFLYGELEEKAGLMQTEFDTAIDEFLVAVLRFLKKDETKQFIKTWKRAKPQNNTEVSAIIAQTPSTVMSDETKTRKHPLVDDADSEREKIAEETEQRQQDTMDQLGEQATLTAPTATLPKTSTTQTNTNDGGGK